MQGKVERKERIETLYDKYTICLENGKNHFPVQINWDTKFFDMSAKKMADVNRPS